MKKILSILFCFAFVIGIYAQERSIELGTLDVSNDSKMSIAYNYVGTSDILLPTTRDTIDLNLTLLNVTGPLHAYVNVTLDKVVGTDTTVIIDLQAKKFNSQSYVSITSGLSAVVSGEIQTAVTSLGVISDFTTTTAAAVDYLQQTLVATKDTLTVAQRIATNIPVTTLYYKYFKVRLILSCNDSVGTGVKVKRVEIQFYKK